MCAPCAEHFPRLCPTRVTHSQKTSCCAFAHAATASSLLEHLGWSKVIGICAENCGSNRHRRCNHQCIQAPLVLPTDTPGLWSPTSMPLHTGVNYYLYYFESFYKLLSIMQLFLKEAATTQQVTLCDVVHCYRERLRVSGPYPALSSAGSQELWSLSHAAHTGCAAGALTSAACVNSVVSALQNTHKWMVRISDYSGLGWILI